MMMNRLNYMVGLSLTDILGENMPTQFAVGEFCTVCKVTRLSRYNNTSVCNACTEMINDKMADKPIDPTHGTTVLTFKAPKRKKVGRS